MKTSPSRILLRGLLAAAICLPSLAAHAVTDEEWDHARAVAAQVYLRYTNDKSDYLDGKKAKSTKELRSMVEGHQADADNLKQFLAAPVSKDYPSWGKEQLVNYWSKTFFQNANLSKKAEQSRNNTIKARISTMSVTEPSAAKPEPEEQPQEQEPQTAPTEQAVAQEAPVQAVDSSSAETSAEEEVAQADQGSTSTWIYVVLLIVLIGIVIWLVLYAMRAMKGPEQQQSSPEKRKKAEPSEQEEKYAPQPEPSYAPSAAADTGIEEMQARYANTIAAKNEEIERLRRALDNSRAAEQEARSQADQLNSRISQLQQQLQSMREKSAEPAAMPRQAPTRQQPAQGAEKVIYLGRANRNRVFVRADRQVTPGKTVYRLTTTNGLTGSFTVESDPSVVALVSLDAQTTLYGACEAPSLAGAESCSRIVTDTAGSAIFEDNCWKVLHPAAIHLE